MDKQQSEKKFKIKVPIGMIITPKEIMTETELRDFFPQVVQDPKVADIWREKASKDPIEDLVDWLQRAGFNIEEQK